MSPGVRWSAVPAHLRDRIHDPPTARVPTPRHASPAAGLNKTELRYQHLLELMKHAGTIREHLRHESINLRLATKTWWRPDFPVITLDGRLEFHEIKGFWRDDARVKFKVAAELYPWFTFRVFVWQKGSGAFVQTEAFNVPP